MKRYNCYGRDGVGQRYTALNEIDDNGYWVRHADAEAEIALLRGAAEADEKRLRDAAAAAGIVWFGCDTPEVLADTIGELRVEIEKWKRVAADAHADAIADAVAEVEKLEERWHRCHHFSNAGEALDRARDAVLALMHGSALARAAGEEK